MVRPTRAPRSRWYRSRFSFLAQITQPGIDFFLAAAEGSKRACVLRKRICALSGATNQSAPGFGYEFDPIALLQAQPFANWFGYGHLALAGNHTAIDIPYHKVRISFPYRAFTLFFAAAPALRFSPPAARCWPPCRCA